MDIFKIVQEISQVVGKDNYLVIGGVNLMLNGYPVSTNDIDILTDDEGVIALSKHYETKIIKEIPEGYIRTIFHIDNVEIEAVSKESNSPRNHFAAYVIMTDSSNNFPMKCARLEDELLAYRTLGRAKDVEKIKWLEDRLKK